jgi:hypothetical protein
VQRLVALAGPSSSRRPLHSSAAALIASSSPCRRRAAKGKRERVAYKVGDAGISNERRIFFANDIEAELVAGDQVGIEPGDEVAGLEAGRVVECRR